MKDTWVFGLGIAWVQAFSFLLSPCPLLSCVRGLGWWSCHATTRLLLWYHFSFTLLLPLDLRAEAPTSPFPAFFLLLGFTGWHSCWTSPLSTSLPLLNFYWATFLLCQPIPFLGLPWPISFLGLSRPIFFLYLFYSYEFLLNPLGFPDPITTSLPLIIFRAYWPLCQHFEFTNSFLGLPRPIYFFFTSYYSHVFTTSFLGLPWPICFFFVTFFFFFVYLLTIILAVPAYWSLLHYFLFLSSSYCWVSSAIALFVKSGHQQW